jgi:Na+/H+ antiporter NhaB
MALIEVIQNRYAYFISVPSLQSELATLNSKQLKKIITLVNSFDPQNKISRKNIEAFATELFIIQKGPPVSLLEYFTKNKTELMNKRMSRIVQEELLIKGLKNIINQFPEKTRYSFMENAKFHISKIVRSKVWRLAALPFDLPFIDQIRIPDELLEKILLDGIDVHSDELLALFRQQNMIDNYERFRKAYRTIAMATAFAFFLEDMNTHQAELKKEIEASNKQAFFDKFKKISSAITNNSDTSEKTDNEIRDEQFNRTLEKFRAKYNEDPTSTELKEIKLKIYGKKT